MIVRSSHIITLPSGNLARDFRWESLGYGRVRVQYNYMDRRRAHQTARRYTVEFLNGKVDSICARSANGGRVEYFKTSTILAELLEMLAEFNEVVHGVAESYRSEPAKVEAEQYSASEADIAALKAKGIPAVQCPAQTKGITCKECRLCSRDRESVVLFEVHGQRKGKARRVIQIKRAQH